MTKIGSRAREVIERRVARKTRTYLYNIAASVLNRCATAGTDHVHERKFSARRTYAYLRSLLIIYRIDFVRVYILMYVYDV